MTEGETGAVLVIDDEPAILRAVGAALRARGYQLLTATTGERAVEIAVTDQGPGIEPSLAEHIFEPFQRGEGGGSSGVGLAICRAIVEAHGGSISAGAANGGGAELSFTIPSHRRGAHG